MACFGFVTFLPVRPDFSFPCFISRISRSTFLPAEGEYMRLDDFLAADFLALDFLADCSPVLFFALLPSHELLLRAVREREIPSFELLLDFFLVAFFVAITILLRKSDDWRLKASCLFWTVAWRASHERNENREQTQQGFVS